MIELFCRLNWNVVLLLLLMLSSDLFSTDLFAHSNNCPFMSSVTISLLL